MQFIKFHSLNILFVLLSFAAYSQTTQTIRGQVLDKQSKQALVGATVALVDTGAIRGTVTDINGYFRIEKIPVGRQSVRISFIGYRTTVLPIIVYSGKEVVLNIELEESVVAKEVVVTAEKNKQKVNNQMATVSARTFSIEETQRYAGSRNDPARMAANFAGVSGANDSRNDIIIRGNSPLGILWRLNGVDIPNPNHFGTFGSTGGPVSMLNNNVLTNSDFLTGAFPADYGNALAGVFDLKMRTGNNEKREFLGQIGFNGVEFGAEGPFSKNKKGSYLINYRYSTLAVFHALGINIGTGAAVPQYQDLSFKIDLPTEKMGKFSVFGLGGKSYVELLDSQKDPKKQNLYDLGSVDVYFGTKTGIAGISNTHFLNTTTYGKLTYAVSAMSNTISQDSLHYDVNRNISIFHQYGNESKQYKSSLNYMLHKKLNAANSFTIGGIADFYNYNFLDTVLKNKTYFIKLRDINDQSAALYQAYALWQHKFSNTVTLNSGLHYQHFALNHSQALEPRLGLRWEFKEGQSLSLGSGLHSQIQNPLIYFDKTRLAPNYYVETNRNVGMTRAAHFIGSYDRSFGRDMRLKAEAYYQYLFNVPVTTNPSFFSTLNYGADFSNPSVDSLVNKGTGKNYGVELTVEKFYSRGYYYLFTASVFESKYKGSDNIERNTAFNGNYVFNALGGKEFKAGEKNIFAIDLKITWAGGRRYVPIDLQKTLALNNGLAVYDFDHAFEKKLKDYFRTDIKFTFRRNGNKVTQEWLIDIQNVFNNMNLFTRTYSASRKEIVNQYQLGIFPVAQYRILF